jgi:hypothetical protein
MSLDALLEGLLEIAKSENYGNVETLPGAGDHHAVCRLADEYKGQLLSFVNQLPPSIRPSFTKAIAAYENTVGGHSHIAELIREALRP